MKKKMNLNALKVTSFVTVVDEKKNETVKGGFEVNVSQNICQFTNLPWQCTWISELNTACGCDPVSDLIICGPVEDL